MIETELHVLIQIMFKNIMLTKKANCKNEHLRQCGHYLWVKKKQIFTVHRDLQMLLKYFAS